MIQEFQGLWAKEGLSSGKNNLCCIYMLKRGKIMMKSLRFSFSH